METRTLNAHPNLYCRTQRGRLCILPAALISKRSVCVSSLTVGAVRAPDASRTTAGKAPRGIAVGGKAPGCPRGVSPCGSWGPARGTQQGSSPQHLPTKKQLHRRGLDRGADAHSPAPEWLTTAPSGMQPSAGMSPGSQPGQDPPMWPSAFHCEVFH